MNATESQIEMGIKVCDECRKIHALLGFAHTDVNRLAKRAARNPVPRLLALVAVAKQQLVNQRAEAAKHLLTHREEA